MAKCKRGLPTFYVAFKRWWGKSGNVEIDLLALSTTHAYLPEVNNQLKETIFKQMLTNMGKVKGPLPTRAVLKLQPIFVCLRAEDKIVKTATVAGIWVLHYKGFNADGAAHEFDWLRLYASA